MHTKVRYTCTVCTPHPTVLHCISFRKFCRVGHKGGGGGGGQRLVTTRLLLLFKGPPAIYVNMLEYVYFMLCMHVNVH